MVSHFEIANEEIYIKELKDKPEQKWKQEEQHVVVRERFQKATGQMKETCKQIKFLAKYENDILDQRVVRVLSKFINSVILPSMLVTSNRNGSLQN